MMAASQLRVLVWVEDVWDTVALTATSEWTVARLKQAALDAATGAAPDPTGYQVKLHGALVLDETVTLAQLNVSESAPFAVLAARRRPVR